MSGCGFTLKGLPYKKSCESLTSKGTLCKNYCRENSFYCVQHGKSLLAVQIDRFYEQSGENYDIALAKQVEIERQENLRLINNSQQTTSSEEIEESITISYDFDSDSEDSFSTEFIETVKILTNLTQEKARERNTVPENKKRKAEDYLEEYFLEQLSVAKKQRLQF